MPLKIIIVGAGIGGLSTAIALARGGHQVEMLEQSRFASEVGAAISLAPNALRCLREWGVPFGPMQAVAGGGIELYDAQARFLKVAFVANDLARSLNEGDKDHDDSSWLLVHRVDLHSTLRAAAEREGAKIRLAARVASVDAERGVVALEDGSVREGDLIIGADGIRSRCVRAITTTPPPGGGAEKVHTGQNAIRFLLPRDKVEANPTASALLSRIRLDNINLFVGSDRRIVMYPCRNGELLNMAVIFPDDEGNPISYDSSYSTSASTDFLMSIVSGFAPELQELCRLGEDIGCWSLATRRPPPTFVRGKLALVGDAAHHFLPHLGQGGAQAIEDAAALGVLMGRGIEEGEVARRLELYNQVRYRHAVTLMMMSIEDPEKADRSKVLEMLRNYVPDATELPERVHVYAWDSYPIRDARTLLARSTATA